RRQSTYQSAVVAVLIHIHLIFFSLRHRQPRSTLFPYTTLFRSAECAGVNAVFVPERRAVGLTDTVAKTSAGAIEYLPVARVTNRSEEHTSELQSPYDLVCRLLLEKKKTER